LNLKYNNPVLWVFLEHWPVLILTPAVLLLIAVLALITRRWDQRDEIAARERARRADNRVEPREANRGEHPVNA
jgi:hypothetical protein